MTLKSPILALFLSGMFTSIAHADIDQGKEAYFMGNYQRALKAFMPDARKGNSYAQIKIGQMYENGWGVERDYLIAKKWYEQAATGGDPIAHVAIGKLYAYGRGVMKDYNTAEAHLLKAAALEYPHAYYVLGDIHNDAYAFGYNESYALKYYVMAAESNAAASSQNGHFRKGTGQWFRLITPKGVQATRRIADEGNVVAQLNTGLRYYFGEGVAINHTTANSYFLMAALAGNAEAQNFLAQNKVMQDPEGFDKIFVFKWFSIAAANGDPIAKTNKAKLQSNMSSEEIRIAEAAAKRWLNKN